MKHKDLDLSRFSIINHEQYYTTDWDISGGEVIYALELDELFPYERHLRGVEAWNLWACYFRDRYLEEWDGKEETQICTTNKQLKSPHSAENEHLFINFLIGNETNVPGETEINNLNCLRFFFPFTVDFRNLTSAG